jgi:hypothetical protein
VYVGALTMGIEEIRRWQGDIGSDECRRIFATGREATTHETVTRAATLFAHQVMPSFE